MVRMDDCIVYSPIAREIKENHRPNHTERDLVEYYLSLDLILDMMLWHHSMQSTSPGVKRLVV